MGTTTATPSPLTVTEELVFAVVNRSGRDFGIVSEVLFHAAAHQRELAALLDAPAADQAPAPLLVAV